MTPDYNHPAVVQLMAAENEIERLRTALREIAESHMETSDIGYACNLALDALSPVGGTK